MVFVPVTVKGGLPMIADVWFSGPDYFGEYDSDVDDLYWQKKDGSKGKPISDKIMLDIQKKDPYYESYIIEQVNDWLGYNARDEQDNLTEEFLILNPRKEK
jgi:hypothetical protein